MRDILGNKEMITPGNDNLEGTCIDNVFDIMEILQCKYFAITIALYLYHYIPFFVISIDKHQRLHPPNYLNYIK